MKKVITGLLVLLCMSALTGCGKDDVTLSNEDNDLVAEYIAGTLLKYSYDNEWKYQKLNSAQHGGSTSSSGTQKPSQTQPATTGQNNTTIQTTKAAGSVSGNTENTSADLLAELPSALGFNGVTLTYNDYVAGSQYPTENYVVSVPAQTGCKVVAVEMTLTNTSGSAVNLTSSGSVVLKLTTGSTGVSNYASMLKNDITTLKNVSLAAGESKEVVVLFQVKESDASSLAGSVISATSSGASLGSLTIN